MNSTAPTPRLLPLILFLVPPATAQVAPTPPATPAVANTVQLEDFVVTGVFNATEARKAITAISTVDAALVSEQVPLSADDLLLNVAGVFVTYTQKF